MTVGTIISLYAVSWFGCLVALGTTIDENPQIEQWVDSLFERGNMLGITYLTKIVVVGVLFPLICYIKVVQLLCLRGVPVIVSWLFSRSEGES